MTRKKKPIWVARLQNKDGSRAKMISVVDPKKYNDRKSNAFFEWLASPYSVWPIIAAVLLVACLALGR